MKPIYLNCRYVPGLHATNESSNQVLRPGDYLIDPDEEKDQEEKEYIERMYNQRRPTVYEPF
jgi:hypothetical protein